ncbi:hypothetical protein GCM10008967_37460 [Bacillus carboniphilus]|uniref:DUF4367 domain-containing protein n=2 Tax=Bacillus carboniphilus TaxID=86663 RepID=A0ABP3GEJ3_9BACI
MVGCGQAGGLKDYDNRELAKELKEEGVHPKLPTKFPVKIAKYERIIPPHDSRIYETIFTGENDEVFSLIINPGQAEYHGDFERENVTVCGNSGFYMNSELPGPSLHWFDGDYSYILEYQTLFSDTEVTKEIMMKIAEFFQ